MPVLVRAALLDGLLDELLHQMRRVRVGRRAVQPGRFNGADDRGFECRVALFEVHRNLAVRNAAAQGDHEADVDQREEREERDDAERNDGDGAEAEGFEALGREQQRRDRAGDDDDGAPQCEPLPPAIPDAANDIDELSAMVHVAGLP